MSAAPVERSRFVTHDVDEGHDYIRRTYMDYRIRMSGSEASFVFSSDLLMVGGVAMARVEHSMAVSTQADAGIDRLSIVHARDPVRSVGPAGRQQPIHAGGTICVPVGVAYQTVWDTLNLETVLIEADVLEAAAAPFLDRDEPLRFDFDTAVSPVAGATWLRTSALVRNVALANVSRAGGALVVDELARLLATTALACFPNSTMTDRGTRPTKTTPESLRRAVAYIDSHLDTPIRLDTLAEAARVSPRALNLTFNRHLGISPIGYVHRARLDAAHHDLQAAQKGDGQTVTAIAARWGFYDLPRFGVTYRKAYGQPPSHTLRRA